MTLGLPILSIATRLARRHRKLGLPAPAERVSRSSNNLLNGRAFHLVLLRLLLLTGLVLLASGCQSTPDGDDRPAGTEVQGPALIAYFTDN